MLLGIERVGKLCANFLFQLVVILLIELRRGDFALLLAGLRTQVGHSGADFLDFGVPELDRVNNNLFADFFRARLDHHNAIGSADDHDVQRALAHFIVGRINNELAVDLADAHGSDWTEKRNFGKGERAGSAVDSEHVGIVAGVSGENEGDDLSLALESLGKHRTHGAIDLAAGEHFAVAHAAFALDEASGKASTGIGVFAVVDGEREKIYAF